ncbi:MAG: ABC transporter ATP-binding protein [Desulfurococcales archaeon]|uniref:ABC transporter ATP-binding protein n=1 Tax=Fervidicoccus fontis TaxID=683846 RepID=A0A7J3SJY7_9CREN
MGETAVSVDGLVKRFGQKEAVKSISFNVFKGEIFGLVGPNGAGKTTTLRIIGTLLKPTLGRVEVFGMDVMKQAADVRKSISYLPEDAGAYPYMTGLEYLRFIASLYGLGEEAVIEGSEISGLGESLNERIKGYSKGMKRRLQVARTLMVRPKLAILDEPTSGIDVLYSLQLRKEIKKKAKEWGITILLSSHNMLEIEYLCDRVAFMHEGIIVDIGTPGELISKRGASNLEEAFMEAIS